jgi:hypothetical protein
VSVVWKFDLAVTDGQIVEMPEDAELLHVAEQTFNRIALWARVNPDASRGRRLILVRGTGHQLSAEPHVGTVLSTSGLVWHVFDGGEQ